jgi:hypothetical protein
MEKGCAVLFDQLSCLYLSVAKNIDVTLLKNGVSHLKKSSKKYLILLSDKSHIHLQQIND